MIKINLIPPEYLGRQKQKVQMARAAGVAFLAVAMMAAVTVKHIQKAGELETNLTKMKKELSALQAQVDKVKELEATKNTVQAHVSAINELLSARFYYTNFINDMVHSFPSTLWIGNLNTSTKPNGVIEFNAGAMAHSGNDVAGWYANLEAQNGRFAKPEIGPISISQDAVTQAVTYSFQIKAEYTAPRN